MLTTDPSTLPFVADGISGGRTWATYRRKTSGALARIVSPALPLRATREDAERDLAAWLKKKGRNHA